MSLGNTSGAAKLGQSARRRDEEMSDSDASSPREMRRCFCGSMIKDGEGLYCSAACARSDAFSTLCNKPNPPSLPSPLITSQPLSRNPSITSTASSSGTTSDWESTHYGRMCRADLRREERREERRRRRADASASSAGAATASTSANTSAGSGSTQSTLSSRGTITSIGSSASLSSHRVPDLVGGSGYHSRNASVASSRTSFSSVGGLSRATSNASTTSRRGLGGVHVDSVIMEDDDEEEEWLASDSNTYPLPLPPSGPKYRVQQYPQPHQRRRPSVSRLHGKKKLEPFGMGQDMRDVLEEIISMEKEFVIDEPGSGMDALVSGENGNDTTASAGVFTAVFDRPPRTPSPGMEGKRQSVVPGAPLRGHRKSMSVSTSTTNHQLASSRFMNDNMNMNANANANANRPRPRPPSMLGHSASLSESHTALYLATASPESGRRSASPPRLKARNSMTFTPEAAGPVIPGFLGHFTPTSSVPNGNAGGNGMSTPSRRRPQHSPTAHHPVMSGWRFPNSNTATPTKLTIDTRNLEVRTPTKQQQQQQQRRRGPAPTLDSAHLDAVTLPHPHPHLLWPAPPALAPSLFPSSPGMGIEMGINGTPNSGFQDPATRFRQQVNTSPSTSASHPNHHAHHQGHGHGRISPPTSGLRLGYLLGSGDDTDPDIEMDIDNDNDNDTHSSRPYHGFGFGARLPVPGTGRGGGMPIYLHPEGFRPNY